MTEITFRLPNNFSFTDFLRQIDKEERFLWTGRQGLSVVKYIFYFSLLTKW